VSAFPSGRHAALRQTGSAKAGSAELFPALRHGGVTQHLDGPAKYAASLDIQLDK